MELQFQKREASCLRPVVREHKQTELTQELRLSDGMPDAGRILGVWGQPVIRSKQWSGDQITVSGGVMAWVLYAPEDGSECRSMDLWVPFQMRWDIPDTESDGVMRVVPALRFADGRTLSSRKIMVRIGLSVHLEALCPMSYVVFEPEELPEEVQILRRTYPALLSRTAGEKTFTMDEEFALPETLPAPSRILRYLARPEITEKKIMGDKVIFRGRLNLNLLYRDGEGAVRSWEEELPFSQFDQMEEDVREDASLDIQIAVTGLELDLMDQRLRLKCALAAQYLAEEQAMLELVQDAYGLNRDVKMREEQISLPVTLEERVDSVSVEQILPGKNAEVLDAVFTPDFPRYHGGTTAGEQRLSGVFQVLFRGEDGTLESSSLRWEQQRDLPMAENCVPDGMVVSQGKIKAMETGDGISLSIPLQVETKTGTIQGLDMASGLELGQEREPDPERPSLVLCRPGKENIWSIARRCGSTMEAIQRANRMDGEISENRILLIPIA